MKALLIFFFLLIMSLSGRTDTLQPLGDEFNDAATFSRWQDIDEVEGWGVSSDEAADINTTTPGHFRIVPKAMGWYMHLRGVLFFKEVTGDFIATTRLRVLSRHNPANPQETPNRLYSLTGIFLHEPRPYITQAAPNPYRTDPVWPPASFGSDYVPNTENYIFLSYGTAGNPGTRQFEIKTTRNSNSTLYYQSTGINQAVHEAWMQVVRIGNTVVCLRKYSVNGAWIVENRYPNPDHVFPNFGATLQVGITAYTDWPNGEPYHNGGVQTSWYANYAAPGPGNPDLISEVDYFRLQRPAAALTESALQGMVMSYNPATDQTSNPPVLLSASPAVAPYLGDNANIPLGLVAPSAAQFSASEGSSINVMVTRSGASLDQPLNVNFQTSSGLAGAADFATVSGTLHWAANDPAQKMVTIPLTSDELAEGPESFSITFSGLDGPATFPASDPQQTATLTVLDHPFDQWRLDRFGPAANSTNAAPEADADGDGLETLIEYVFQTDPVTSMDVRKLPTAVTDGTRIGLQCICPASPGVRLEIQRSDNLNSWETIATRTSGASAWTTGTAGVDIAVGPQTNEVSVFVPRSDERSFLRLQAIRN